MFLREACALPNQFVLRQELFCPKWMLVEDLTAAGLDAKIRSVGWHFMWMMGTSIRRGFGRTSDQAIHQALQRALNKTAKEFNASELESFLVSKFPGFYMAKVIVHPRQIQRLTSLDT